MIARSDSRSKLWVMWGAVVLIILPAGIGFAEKLWLFISAVRKDQVAGFVVVPVANYLIITAGMICLLVWAVANGMFRDVEGPKYDMLEHEDELDRLEGRPGSHAP